MEVFRGTGAGEITLVYVDVRWGPGWDVLGSNGNLDPVINPGFKSLDLNFLNLWVDA